MLEAIFRTTDSAEQIRVTQHAHDNGTLVAMSFVATASIMKAVLAAVRAQKRHQYVRLNHTDVSLSQAGYHIATQRLPRFDMVHAVMLAKDDNLIFGDVREQLGRYLLSPRTTTPMLERWVPVVIEEILQKKAVTMLTCFGFDAYRIEFKDNELDAIVTDLLQRKAITIDVSHDP